MKIVGPHAAALAAPGGADSRGAASGCAESRRVFHMKFAIVPVLLAFAFVQFGCASDGGGERRSNSDKRREIAVQEVSRMSPPSQKLSRFSQFELKPITMSPEIADGAKKQAYAEKLGGMLEARIEPLLDEWRANGGGAGTLVIQPDVVKLKVVSGGARFWVGAWAGESNVDMNLRLIDKASGKVIASPRIARSAGSMSGAWSFGATDQNLLRYIVDISYQYLAENS
jgi:hypothetical protein